MPMNIPGASQELCKKFERILSMDIDQLNELYIMKMQELRLEIVNYNQPDLFEIYRVLIPELFDLAARAKRAKSH